MTDIGKRVFFYTLVHASELDPAHKITDHVAYTYRHDGVKIATQEDALGTLKRAFTQAFAISGQGQLFDRQWDGETVLVIIQHAKGLEKMRGYDDLVEAVKTHVDSFLTIEKLKGLGVYQEGMIAG